ncbi:MAG: glyoxylase-like metal-dependent hydrolase (beta-lactamase superfamily II) [Saprospiraceae bacterium]|jgi:glyoxylase-like metal-dependent hydrolase (beta-lactamase superfamily II)
MIKVLDLNFLGHQDTIASFLIETLAGPILIETGPHSTLPVLEKALAEHGYKKEDIMHVFLTHIHLDHAGAAWVFAEHGATIYLHPKGVQHLSDPSRLLESATRIYGNKMDELWGTLKPIPREQLVSVGHKEKIKIGKTKLKAWHTPGHAVHHISWEHYGELIAGDVCGVKIKNGPVVPPCPPPDIDVETWVESIRMIRLNRFDAIYLTHYGKFDNAKEICVELSGRLKNWANWIKPFYENDMPQVEVVPQFQEYVRKQLVAKGVNDEDLARYEGANPSWMSVAGLYRYWRKKG